MIAVPTLLNEHLLQRLEARLRAAGSLIVDAWAPGMTDGQIDDLLAPLGIELPEEAREWWRWHDGVLIDDNPRATEISPRRTHLPLRYVAEDYQSLGGAMRQLYGLDGLLNPVGDRPTVYFHCDVPRDSPVPIYTQNDDVSEPCLVLPSIGELVLAWIDLIDRAVWTTNPDGSWAWDHRRVPPADVLKLGIY
ncbi:MAG: hypothetical protein ACRDKY_04520 [Solirubrobacteraceae bacterium]